MAHTDYFDPEMYAQNADIQDMIKRGLFNRSLTTADVCIHRQEIVDLEALPRIGHRFLLLDRRGRRPAKPGLDS